MSGEVSEAQALKNVIQVLGPIKILYRGDTDEYDKQRGRQWRESVRRWMRTLEWHGSRDRW